MYIHDSRHFNPALRGWAGKVGARAGPSCGINLTGFSMTTNAYVFCHPSCPCQRGSGRRRAPYLASEWHRHAVDLVHNSIRRWNLISVNAVRLPGTVAPSWGDVVMKGQVANAAAPDAGKETVRLAEAGSA